MKKLILVGLFISSVSFAEIWDSPTGKMECKPMETQIKKIVKKKKPKEPPKPLIIEKIVEKVVEKVEVVTTFKKNRLSLLVGVSPNGYDFERVSNVVYVSDSMSPVLGISYGRQFNENWGIQAVGATNYTLMVGPTYSW